MSGAGRPGQTTAVIPAAGSGSRFGGAKLWADLNGQPVLFWAMRALGDPASQIDSLVVAADPADHRRIMALAAEASPRLGCRCTPGGETRQRSVFNGLELCSGEMVLVHDGARPGLTAELCARVVQAARQQGAATAYVAVADTTARVEAGLVQEVLVRAQLGAIQTPQAFHLDLLRRAHSEAAQQGLMADDDASLVLALGQSVAAVPGDPRNLKVTTSEDLLALRSWLGDRDWSQR